MKKVFFKLKRILIYGAFTQLFIGPSGAGVGLLPGFLLGLFLPAPKESGILQIDYYAYRSGLRDYTGTGKMMLFTFSLLLCLLSPSSQFHLALLLIQALITLLWGRIPVVAYLHFLETPMVFILLGALGIMLQIEIRPFALRVTPETFFNARQISLRALSAISCLYSLNLSTPLSQLLMSLRQLKVPKMMIELMYMMYRYVFVLFSLYAPMKKAYAMKLSGMGAASAIRGSGMLWSALFRRSYRRAEISFLAMNSRAEDAEIAFLSSAAKSRPRGAYLVLSAMAITGVFFAFGGWR